MSLVVNIEKKLPGFQLNISFRCDRNTIGLLGSSGSGKSMTLRCIAGLEKPDKGHISLNGTILFDSSKGINLPPQNRKTGFLFQNYALFPHMTVAQNIKLGLRNPDKQKKTDTVTEFMSLVRLQGFEERYPSQLSGGQQQRAALARALALNPSLLLLDEPFSALDNHLRGELEQQFTHVLKEFRNPSIFVTHNLDEAYRLCPELLILENGQTVASGTRDNIFARPPTYDAARLTGCQNISRAKKISTNEIEAIDWNCRIRVKHPVCDDLSHVGVRAHHIRLTNKQDADNTFKYRLMDITYSPDHVMLSLMFDNNSAESGLKTVKVKMFSSNGLSLQKESLPPFVKLPADEIFLISNLSVNKNV